MKTQMLVVEAQQICLEYAKEVLNAVEITVQRNEKNGSIKPDTAVIDFSPYNNGYSILLKAEFDWVKCEALVVNSFWHTIYIQPGTFFDEYIEEGKGFATAEWSLPLKDSSGYVSGRKNVASIDEFRSAARDWARMVKKQIES